VRGRADDGGSPPLRGDGERSARRRQSPLPRGEREGPCCILLSAGTTNLSAARIDEATNYAREALGLTRQLGARGIEARALCLTADIAATSRAENAEGYYRQALALAEPRGMRPLIAHCHLGLGKLYRGADKGGQAQEYLTIAAAMYREMEMTIWLEKAEAEMRQLG